MKRKIIIIGPVYPFRGAVAQSNTALCLDLSKNHDVTAISFKRLYPRIFYKGDFQKTENKKFNIKTENIIDSINPLNWFRVFLRIIKINPEGVYFQWWTIFLAPFYLTMLFLLKFTKIKTFILIHSVIQHEEHIFDNFLTKIVFKQADYLKAYSNYTVKEVKKIFPKAKVKSLNYLPYNIFNYKPIPKLKARKIISNIIP